MKPWLLFSLVVAINSQALFAQAGNVLGIRGLQEAFLAFLLIYSTVSLLAKALNQRIPTMDFAVIGIVLIFWLGPAFLSYLYYNQPLPYGLIESRRALAGLVLIPLLDLSRRYRISNTIVYNTISAIAVVACLFGILVHIGVIPQSILPNATEVGGSELALARAGRIGTAKYYVLFAIIIGFERFLQTRKLNYLLLGIACFLAIIVFVQERQLMLISAGYLAVRVTALLVQKKHLKHAVRLSLVVLSVGVVTSMFPTYIDNEAQDLIVLFTDLKENELAESGRSRAYRIVVADLLANPWQGRGALYLYWHDGFHRIYGSSFYLADIGVVGTAFRFGILFIPIMLLVVYISWRAFARMPRGLDRRIVLGGFAICFGLLPTAALIEYRGYFWSLLLFLALNATRAKNITRRDLSLSDDSTAPPPLR